MNTNMADIDSAARQFVRRYARSLNIVALRRLRLGSDEMRPSLHLSGVLDGPALEISATLGQWQSTGRLTIVSDSSSAHIDFDRGRIVDAHCTLGWQDAAEKTVLRALMWSGRFAFDSDEKPSRDVLGHSPTSYWLMRAACEADEVAKILKKLPKDAKIILAAMADVNAVAGNHFVQTAVNAGSIAMLLDLWLETDLQTIRNLAHYSVVERVLFVPGAAPGVLIPSSGSDV